ncbi:MAG: 1-acyl-sn-glycerol-3-phosphate acyltransferase [Phycisphaerales bacterium]|nr:1-acyl-sn-glycerol-3-phosphate acyltransferase [Phycisphaerales bacterium]
MSLADWVITAFGVFGILLAWAFFSAWVMDNPRGEVDIGLAWRGLQVYSFLIHRLRVHGRAHCPDTKQPGPLIVVVNHTAGVDPILIQAACPFEVRWMMAAEMRLPIFEWFWSWARIISVEREGREVAAAREAIRHVKAGGVLGIFPEGAIERPAGRLLPFIPGVGFIIAKTGAPVLPAIIEGTPDAEPAWASLWRFSRASLTFYPAIHYKDSGLSPAQIAADLHRRFEEWTGWPVAE